MRAQRVAIVAAIVLVALVAGVAVGRWSVASCTDVRDDHAAVAREIRSQAQTDIDAMDPDVVGRAHAIVTSRRDCFSSAEIDEIVRLNEIRGPDGSSAP